MSPVREIRYIHALIVMSKMIQQVKMYMDKIEANNELLKKTIKEDNQIDLFSSEI
jgi:hypothetical protein